MLLGAEGNSLWPRKSAPTCTLYYCMTIHSPLIDLEEMEELATPSNIRLGNELAEADEVIILERTVQGVKAKVDGGQTHMVVMTLGETGLDWTCTCTKDAGLFCKHCVATVVKLGV